MHLSLTTTLPLLSTLLPLTTAQQSTDANGCVTFEPTDAFQIDSLTPDDSESVVLDFADNTPFNNVTAANSTTRFSPKKPHRPSSSSSSSHRRSANVPFIFSVAQSPDGSDYNDLVVAFTDLPCSGPGPFSFEFNFQPDGAYFAQGEGQINMFRVDPSALSGGAPTWNSVEPLTGSLIGTFELPEPGSGEAKLLYLNQLVCEELVVLRFGISRYSSQEGIVAYFNQGGMGLRERNGC